MPKLPVEARLNEKKLVLFCDANETKRVVVRRPALYMDAIKCARRHFPSISVEHMVLQTDELEISLGERAEITEDAWDIVADTVSRFFVAEQGKQITVTFKLFKDETNTEPISTSNCSIIPTITLRDLLEGFEAHLRSHKPPIYDGNDLLQFYYNGRALTSFDSGTQTPQQLNMADGAIIECILRPRCVSPPPPKPLFAPISGPGAQPFGVPTTNLFGVPGPGASSTSQGTFGKPVIYVFAKEMMDVTVSVSLIPQWKFSAWYPVVPISNLKTRLHQRVEWNVETQEDGSLKERGSGLDIAYLFWEAKTTKRGLPSPPGSPVLSGACFDPTTCDVTADDSVLLAVEALPSYLEKTLAVLGLHTEARTSFVTYWLPSFLEHTHVALRFVPQKLYEPAAPLIVTPTPDVVTRIFMLFKGVKPSEVGWEKAIQKAQEEPDFWKQVVGTNVGDTEELPRLRVLEWGGMEIVS